MPRVRLLGNKKMVADTWMELLNMGAVSRIASDNLYLVSSHQLEWLQESRRPFELVDGATAPAQESSGGE